jgi:exopolyphosphatase/guanosine-5'-triphosphate,3'-diphosphate pyrophosphatase
MELFDFDQLTISEWALREGIALDAAGHHDPAEWSDDPHAIRGAAVAGLARRCNSPEHHTRQVAHLALELFDGTAALHGLDADDRELLEFAALLHDIGEHVSSSGHHKHGAYLIRNAQLRGFAPDQIELLAAVVRWHRRGEPRVTDEFPLLDTAAMDRVRLLVAILRVADGLDRSRTGSVRDLEVTVTPSLVLLRLTTAGDDELELWGARRKRSLLERVLDREIELTSHAAGRTLA